MSNAKCLKWMSIIRNANCTFTSARIGALFMKGRFPPGDCPWVPTEKDWCCSRRHRQSRSGISHGETRHVYRGGSLSFLSLHQRESLGKGERPGASPHRLLWQYKIHSVNLLPIQEQIVQHCPEEEMTILIRRFMMKIAQRIARETGSLMLITEKISGRWPARRRKHWWSPMRQFRCR